MEIVASTTSSSSVGGDELLTKAINLSDDEFNLIIDRIGGSNCKVY